MRNFKRTILALVLLVVGIFILLFMLENQQMISLSILGSAAPALPVSALVLFALLLGMVVGPFFSWIRKR